MSNKRYYWLKLKEDFFEEDTLAWLEEQENGKEYCLFYLKLCLKSIKTNGTLIRNVGHMLVPYDAKKLGEITKTDLDTVLVAMELFKKIGLVQVLENGEIYMTQLENMVGSETNKAELMRKKRAELKDGVTMLPNVTGELPKCYTDIDKELDKDKEIKKDSKKLTRHKYGEYSHVLLDDEQLSKLKDKFPSDYQDRIKRLDEYIEMSGKKYKNFYLTILNWAKKDKPKESTSNDNPYSGLKYY